MEYLDFISSAAAVSLALIIAYNLGTIMYNLYFHPLRKYPGPRLLGASRVPYYNWMRSGTLAINHKRLHEIYGPIVRTAPNELSFSDPSAWRTIFEHDQAGEPFQKNPVFNQPALNGVHTILTAEGERYRRNKRLMQHAFSERALREQSSILESTTNLLIRRLKQTSESNVNGIVNLLDWYMWTLFDLVGDLSFGETFHCLDNAEYSNWVALVRNGFKLLSLSNISKQLAPLDKLVTFLIPNSMKEKRKKMFMGNRATVDRRLRGKSDRKDFLSYLIDDQNGEAMTLEELYANAILLVIAGSASTAGTLTALTYYLLTNPIPLQKVVNEIRTTYVSEEEISCGSVGRLVYLGAVISEALRMFPPFPEGLPRLTPQEGAEISGAWVPKGTFVQVATLATHRSGKNFVEPDTFIPERWLGDPKFLGDNRAASQPFSVGPRSCMGRSLAILEIRLIIAKLLWNFDITMCKESENWDDQRSWILWDPKPLMVQLAPVVRG